MDPLVLKTLVALGPVLVFLAEACITLRDADAARRIRPLLAPYSGLQLAVGQTV